MDYAKRNRHGFCYREKFGHYDADIGPKKQPVNGCCLYGSLHTVFCLLKNACLFDEARILGCYAGGI